MFNNRILKILALLMVMNILIVPLTSFTPQQQNKYKVYAAEGIVDIRFFNAVVSMIGITAAGLATMSPSFSIPEADLVEMKNNFDQSLEADAVKKQAWLSAQTEYLAGGVAKTMGAIELAKIGVNDVYNEFKNYIINNNNYLDSPLENTITTQTITTDAGLINAKKTMKDITKYIQTPKSWTMKSSTSAGIEMLSSNTFDNITRTDQYYVSEYYLNDVKIGSIVISGGSDVKKYIITFLKPKNTDIKFLKYYYNEALSYGVDLNQYFTVTNGNVVLNNGDIVNSTDSTRSLIPTIPWIDATVPIGTIVTPAIAAPYAGSVPIDVPITAPIDPPIDEPVDPPVEDNIAGTIAAILAGLTPIAGFLEYILAGQVSLTDAIEAGITGVIDGIGDIAGILTDGITSSLTDIQTSIGSLLDPPTETLDLDKLKNLNSVLFTKFPFSIPFDFIAIVTAINADPVAPVLTIPFNMQDFGGSNSNVEIDLSIYDNFANIARQIGFIGFVIFMLFNTRKLIWK